MTRIQKSRLRLSVYGALLLILIAAGFLAARSFLRPRTDIPPENLTEIVRGELVRSVVATGSIAPLAKVELKSKSSGLVKSLLVQEGQVVHQGDVLVELDKEVLTAQLKESEASLQAVRARLEEAEANYRASRSRKDKLFLDQKNAEDNLAFMKREQGRLQRMNIDHIISQSDLDRGERSVFEANSQVETLKSDLIGQDLEIEATLKNVARVRAEVIQAEAAVERTQESLRYATIRSPIGGVVLKRHVEVGDAVSSILQLGSSATLVMTLGDMKSVFVEGRIDESDIGQVHENMKARVRVDSYRDKLFQGLVTQISPLGIKRDNIIGFDVKVAIRDPENLLRVQMSANAEIVLEERLNVLIIPENAVIYDKQRNAFAQLYDPAAPESRRRIPIKIGISDGTRAQVLEGLNEKQKVVLQ